MVLCGSFEIVLEGLSDTANGTRSGQPMGAPVTRVRTELEEEQFLIEFRGAALKWAAYAALAGSVMYAAFFLIAWLREPHSAYALAVRAALVLYLGVVAYCLWQGRWVNYRNYAWFAGTASAVALAGTVALLLLRGDEGQAVAVQASPAVMFGLFLHYAFLRLPRIAAAAIGWVVGAAAVVWAPAVTGGSEVLRNAVYLSFANVFGMIIGRLVEERERKLFYERKDADAARQQARERQLAAEEATNEKTRLIAAISHDLRQPMTASVAHLAVVRHLLERGDDAEARQQLEQAQRAVEVMGATLDHLLDTARYESGAESPRIDRVELSVLMETIYTGMVGEAGERGVDLRLHLPAARVMLSTNAQSIQRVMGNLVGNAIKFTACRPDRPGKVLVAARLRGDTCRLDVIDTGIGIAAEDETAIWKPYVQLGRVERDRERGLGLGLHLVRTILARLPGHTISMSSNVGRGSRFTVTLPARRDDASAAWSPHLLPSEPPLPSLEPLRGAGVLLLEDDRDARHAIAALMEQWGMDVTAAPTVDELLSAIDGTAPRRIDAIVCDYRLAAGRLGTDAIASIRACLGYAPRAVLITGDVDVDALRRAPGEHTSVLAKPFGPSPLAQRLLACIGAGPSPIGA